MTCQGWLGFISRLPRVWRVIYIGFAWITWVAFKRSRALSRRRRAWAAMVVTIYDIGACCTIIFRHPAFPITDMRQQVAVSLLKHFCVVSLDKCLM